MTNFFILLSALCLFSCRSVNPSASVQKNDSPTPETQPKMPPPGLGGTLGEDLVPDFKGFGFEVPAALPGGLSVGSVAGLPAVYDFKKVGEAKTGLEKSAVIFENLKTRLAFFEDTPLFYFKSNKYKIKFCTISSKTIFTEEEKKWFLNPLFPINEDLPCDYLPKGQTLWSQMHPLILAMKNKNRVLFDTLLQNKKLKLEIDNLNLAIAISDEGENYYLEKLLDARIDFSEGLSHKILDEMKDKTLKGRIEEIIILNNIKFKYKIFDKVDVTERFDSKFSSPLHENILNGEFVKAVKLIEDKNYILDAPFYGERTTHYQETPLKMAFSKFQETGEKEYLTLLDKLLENGARTYFTSGGFKNYTIFDFILSYLFDEKSTKRAEVFPYLEKFLIHGANPANVVKNEIGGESVIVLFVIFNNPLGEYEQKILEVVKKYYPDLVEQVLKLSMIATISGYSYETYFNSKKIKLDGGSFHSLVFQFLKDAWKDFYALKAGSTRPLDKKYEIIDGILAKSLEYMKKDPTEILTEINDREQTKGEIFFLPSGWPGHATSIIFLNNLFIKGNNGERKTGTDPGLKFYNFSQNTWNIDDLNIFLKNSFLEKIATIGRQNQWETGHFNSSLKLRSLTGENVSVKGCDQTIGNCTWSSSALLGFQVLLALLELDDLKTFDVFDPKFKIKDLLASSDPLFKEFTYYVTYYFTKTYINFLEANAQKATCAATAAGFGAIYESIFSNLFHDVDSLDPSFEPYRVYLWDALELIFDKGYPLDRLELYGTDKRLKNSRNIINKYFGVELTEYKYIEYFDKYKGCF